MKLEAIPCGATALQWLIERTQAALTPHAKGIAAVDRGRVRGMVVYDNWTHNSVQAHMAVDSPIVWRTLLPEVFRYPFQHRGVLLGVIPEDNHRSNDMVMALGFRLRHAITDGWAEGVDLNIYEMRREECRWLARDPLPTYGNIVSH